MQSPEKNSGTASRAQVVLAEAENILRRVDLLAGEGSMRQAIALATEANRRLRDAGLERRLVRLRIQAVSEMVVAGSMDWPPVAPDVFTAQLGPPEASVAALSSNLLASAIQHHGCLLVRGLISPEEATVLREGIDHVFETVEAAYKGIRVDPVWYAPVRLRGDSNLILQQLRRLGHRGGGIFTVDSPRVAFDLIETFHRSGVVDVIEEYLGERPTLSAQKAALRRVSPDAGTDWHQDGAFLGAHIRAVNVWLALSQCGVDAPGLDLLPMRVPTVLETGTHGAKFRWSIGPAVVDRAAGDMPVTAPVFAPGDALLFDQLLVHRTGIRPEMTARRWAAESWFFAPSTRPQTYFPVVL